MNVKTWYVCIGRGSWGRSEANAAEAVKRARESGGKVSVNNRCVIRIDQGADAPPPQVHPVDGSVNYANGGTCTVIERVRDGRRIEATQTASA